MIYNEEVLEKKAIEQSIALITAAIKTAPKSRGLNSLKTIVLTGKEKDKLAEKMAGITLHPFPRDSKNIKDADAVVLIGTKIVYIGLNCRMCGKENCKENEKENGLCIFNLVDLGIALGSAVSTCSDLKIDNRIMYTAGIVARDMGFFPEEFNVVMGIPLKISQKNIFFDRK